MCATSISMTRVVCARPFGVTTTQVLFVAITTGGEEMIILGVILALLGLLLSVPVLWIIGLVLIVVGAVLWIAGSAGREIGGRRHYY